MATKTILSLIALFIVTSAQANNKVVYGIDNRKDVFQVTNALHKKLAQSTAAMVKSSQIQSIQGLLALNFNETLETAENICPSERFAEQSVGAICSGFLVGEDTIVTAGHCYLSLGISKEAACAQFSWVFNYAIDSQSRDPRQGLAQQDVYKCKEVIKANLTQDSDFAVIRLDRKVSGRAPLKFRKGSKIASNTGLLVIGHPSGLPSKVSDGGRIVDNAGSKVFATNLDTFHGNSGSAVFNAKTGLVEGILVQGRADYRPSINGNPWSCQVVNVCDELGQACAQPDRSGLKGEIVTRITQLTSFIPKR